MIIFFTKNINFIKLKHQIGSQLSLSKNSNFDKKIIMRWILKKTQEIGYLLIWGANLDFHIDMFQKN